MDRAEVTGLLSRLLERDVLSSRQWASEVKYLKMDGEVGRVDYMSFHAPQQFGPTEAAIQGGHFTCYEVKSCMDDYRSGHGLNFIGDWNALVMPMQLYRQFAGEQFSDASVYVPLPYYIGRANSDFVYESYESPADLTPDASEWKLYKISRQVVRSDRRHGTAELLYAMLKAGR